VKLVGVGLLLCAVVAAIVWRFVSVDAASPDSPDEPAPFVPHLVVRDSSPAGNDGIKQGRPMTGLPGHRGTSYSFGRPGSWIEVPSSADLNPGTRNFAMSVWVNFRTAPTGHATIDIIRKGLSFTRTGEYKLEIIYGGVIRCTTKDTDGREYRISSWGRPVTDGRWHHVGCARDRGSWTVRVDGWSRSKPDHLGAIGNAMPLSIGSKYGLEDGHAGRVDEVRLRVGGHTVGLWHLDERPARRPAVSGPTSPAG
jgi:hypothetical protein